MSPAEQFNSLALDLRLIADTLDVLFPGSEKSNQRRKFFLHSASELVVQAKFEPDPLTPLLTHFITTLEESKG